MEKMRLMIATQILTLILRSDLGSPEPESDLDYSKNMKHITCKIALEWADTLLDEAEAKSRTQHRV